MKLTIARAEAGMIWTALGEKDPGADYVRFAVMARLLKGAIKRDGEWVYLPDDLGCNIEPGKAIVTNGRTGEITERTQPGFPDRTWAFKERVTVEFSTEQASTIKQALEELKTKKGKDGDPIINISSVEVYERVLTEIVPRWEKAVAPEATKRAAVAEALEEAAQPQNGK